MRFVQAGTMALGAVIYLVIIIYFASADTSYSAADSLLFTALAWSVMLVIVTVLVIIDSVRSTRLGRTAQLAKGAFIVKLAAVPFFVLNFAIMTLIALGGLATFIVGGIVLTLAVGVVAWLTYLAMLSTSVYGWAVIVRLRREGRMDTLRAVIYTLLLLVFVADIVAAILLYRQARGGTAVATAPSDSTDRSAGQIEA